MPQRHVQFKIMLVFFYFLLRVSFACIINYVRKFSQGFSPTSISLSHSVSHLFKYECGGWRRRTKERYTMGRGKNKETFLPAVSFRNSNIQGQKELSCPVPLVIQQFHTLIVHRSLSLSFSLAFSPCLEKWAKTLVFLGWQLITTWKKFFSYFFLLHDVAPESIKKMRSRVINWTGVEWKKCDTYCNHFV